MDSDLVHEPRGEELLVDVGAHEPDPLLVGDVLVFARAREILSVTTFSPEGIRGAGRNSGPGIYRVVA